MIGRLNVKYPRLCATVAPNNAAEQAKNTDSADLARQEALAAKLAESDFPVGYERGEEVGRGGMGIVFRARHHALNRDVAVKLLRDEFVADGTLAAYFLEEARITAQLQHPNIPPVHEVGTLPGGRPFLVMKLIKGNTLQEELQNVSDLKAETGRFVTIFEGIAQAVAYAHQRRVIHRDLKPGNVMVGPFGEVQVMDWGIAKVLPNPGSCEPASSPEVDIETIILSSRREAEDGTQDGAAKGTPSFMSPEQAKGEVARIDQRTDVFALGAILCCILTGQPPYTGTKLEKLAKATLGDTREALERLDACGGDSELVALAKRCLEVNPANRPANAGEIAAAVAEWRVTADERIKQAELKAQKAATAAAEAERDRVKHLYILAMTAFNQMVFGLQGEMTTPSGMLDLQRQFLTNARSGLTELKKLAGKAAGPDRTLVWSYLQMGRVELALGNAASALAEYQAGYERAKELADANRDPNSRQDLYASLVGLGDTLSARGEYGRSCNCYGEALELARQRAESDPDDVQAQLELGEIYEKVGAILWFMKATEPARDNLLLGLEIRKRLAVKHPTDAMIQRGLINSYSSLGIFYQEGLRDFPGAIRQFQAGLAVAASFPDRTKFPEEQVFLNRRVADAWGYIPLADRAAHVSLFGLESDG
jgi:serine/threonine protein kinase